VAQPQLTILGVTVLTNGNTEFEDEGDNPISSADFFARAPARLVSVDGQLEGTVLVAREIELEGEGSSHD
jgi:NAD(P)H-nitrite reductase large subunit